MALKKLGQWLILGLPKKLIRFLKCLVNLLHFTNNVFTKKAGYKIFCSEHVFSRFMRAIKQVPCPELKTVKSKQRNVRSVLNCKSANYKSFRTP